MFWKQSLSLLPQLHWCIFLSGYVDKFVPESILTTQFTTFLATVPFQMSVFFTLILILSTMLVLMLTEKKKARRFLFLGIAQRSFKLENIAAFTLKVSDVCFHCFLCLYSVSTHSLRYSELIAWMYRRG